MTQGLWETLYAFYVPDDKEVLTSYVHYQPCGYPAPKVDSVLAALQVCGGCQQMKLTIRNNFVLTKKISGRINLGLLKLNWSLGELISVGLLKLNGSLSGLISDC